MPGPLLDHTAHLREILCLCCNFYFSFLEINSARNLFSISNSTVIYSTKNNKYNFKK